MPQPGTEQPTLGSVWQGASGDAIRDEMLEWPPDVFGLTNLILRRSDAYRFALSPPAGGEWPASRFPGWADAVCEAGREWGCWAEDGSGPLPELLTREWAVIRAAAGLPLTDLGEGKDWRCCEALLTVHAIADEACAGLGVALDAGGGAGLVYRARARELLVRTRSLARLLGHRLRVVPKLLTPATGTSIRALSRYASVHLPGVELHWHKLPSRRPGAPPHDKGVNFLLLPWPLRVRESDFHPLSAAILKPARESYGFFEFVPSERLDLDLVDRMLVAARDEAHYVNVLVLPECAVDVDEIDDLEALLVRHGVVGLVAGVREPADRPDGYGRNWVHIGVCVGEHWMHVRQDKHHRWALDEAQIYQYHLGGALHPHVRWWESIEVPRRSVQLIDVGEGATMISLVCEDLAQIDEVASMVRSVGPTIVVTPLLDGPQLRSRWAARYASVLADDPGSAVLTLTSHGMARRSRPHGHESSPVVALWKDAGQGIQEIALEAGAQGILLSASTDRSVRRSADGRRPVENGTELFNMSVYQVRAANTGTAPAAAGASAPPMLDVDELTVLATWAEAMADALAFAPERVEAVSAQARAGAAWRATLRLPEPSARLDQAIAELCQTVQAARVRDDEQPLDAVIRAVYQDSSSLDNPVRQVLRAAVEQRETRQAYESGQPTIGVAAITPASLETGT
jgi:hypothetical protein